MKGAAFAGIETGGSRIRARVVDAGGRVLAEGRWPATTPDAALTDLADFLTGAVVTGGTLAAIGIAAFGPLVRDVRSDDYGRVLSTPKAGWSGSNLRAALTGRFNVPVVVDTDVNAAACAEWQLGAGRGVRSLAYVTVGTGIGGGLVLQGRPLEGALHPEIGHIRVARREQDREPSVCPFHDSCVEGLASGPALTRRLAAGRALADDPAVLELAAEYLGELAATLVLAWSPERIVWGGGVMSTPRLLERLRSELSRTLAGYGVGEAVAARDFCVSAQLADSGLEGALLMARARALLV
jgi:fructokinase